MKRASLLALVSQKITEIYIMLTLVFIGCVISNLAVAYLFDSHDLKHILFYRLYLPAYVSLALIWLIVVIANHITVARKELLIEPYDRLISPCRAITGLIKAGRNELVREYVSRRLFVDYFSLLDYLKLWLDSGRSKSINKHFEMAARRISLSANDKHDYFIFRGVTTILSTEEVQTIVNAWTEQVLRDAEPGRTDENQ